MTKNEENIIYQGVGTNLSDGFLSAKSGKLTLYRDRLFFKPDTLNMGKYTDIEIPLNEIVNVQRENFFFFPVKLKITSNSNTYFFVVNDINTWLETISNQIKNPSNNKSILKKEKKVKHLNQEGEGGLTDEQLKALLKGIISLGMFIWILYIGMCSSEPYDCAQNKTWIELCYIKADDNKYYKNAYEAKMKKCREEEKKWHKQCDN